MIKAFVLGIPFYLGNPPPRKEREGKWKEERKRIMYRRNTALSQKWVYAPNEQTNNQLDVRRPTYLILIFSRERERRCVKIWETAERKATPALLESITCVQSRYQSISIYVVIRYLTSQNTIILGKVTSISTRWGIYTLF